MFLGAIGRIKNTLCCLYKFPKQIGGFLFQGCYMGGLMKLACDINRSEAPGIFDVTGC